MKKCFNGLTTVNVELTSRCNKECWMCGRRKVDKDYPEIAMNYGDMDFVLVEKIAAQLPENIVVQLHNNGEPLLYPRFKEAAQLFARQITNFDTNGKLLVEKADEIIDVVDTMAISVFENDEEADEQYEIIEKFLKIKGERKPYAILRINGDVDVKRYEKFGLVMASRVLHAPMGSFNYKKAEPTVPEVGICLDFLNHMAIDRNGEVSICVRFDPKRLGVIGDANKQSLFDIWNGEQRMKWLELHKKGKRKDIPLCSYCHFWGVPTGRGNAVHNVKEKVDDSDVVNKQRAE
ncbi:MAG: SPASM domain-containing protein [Candidatus Omnitrophica bacterium]|nr:SPASM domain-containing protein [Candidatus Omnitrophota bacterium]